MDKIVVAQIMGKWNGGGVESVIMNYYRFIDRNIIQFHFICDSDSTNIPYDEIKKLGGKVILVPPYQKIFRYMKTLKKVFIENKYKIVHSNINTLSIFPLYVAKKARVPVRISHSHSTTSPVEFKRNLLKKFLRIFSKIWATDYFACSKEAAIFQFGKKTYKKGNIFFVNNAIDLHKFKYNAEINKKMRKKFKIDDEQIIFGHVGRFVSVKNHLFLIKVFYEYQKNYSNSVLVLVGQGPLFSKIKKIVNELNLDKSVLFLGQRDDVNDIYQMFDIFCLPSLYEGFPVVGVEAQAVGNFCVFSDNITKDIKIVDDTCFMNISVSPKVWANEIYDRYKRSNKKMNNNLFKEISDMGYNISIEAKKLEDKYIYFYREN